MIVNGKMITVLSTQIQTEKLPPYYKGDKNIWRSTITYLIDTKYYTVARHAKNKSDSRVEATQAAWRDALGKIN